MKADLILKQAAGLVAGDRDRQHGAKRQNHENIAHLWRGYLSARFFSSPSSSAPPFMDFGAKDVALMMVLLKAARTMTGAHNPDDYLDMAGYAGCAGELADEDNPVGICVPLSPEVTLDTDSRITREHTHSRIQPELPSDCERQWPEPQADGPRRNVASFPPPFTQR